MNPMRATMRMAVKAKAKAQGQTKTRRSRRTTAEQRGVPAASHRVVRRPVPNGMTLLELMLALTLTAIVLVAISTAVDIHLRVLQTRRDHVEHIQVARAVLGIIAADLRSTIQQHTTDFSCLESMAAQLGSAEDAMSPPESESRAGGSPGAGSGGSEGSNRPGQGTSGPSSSGQNPGGTSGRSPSTGSQSSSGQNPGGTSGRSPSTGSQSSSGQSPGGTSGRSPSTGSQSSSGSTGASDAGPASDASTNIASAANVPPTPGLYGNQYELQLDVSRLPRVDEYERMYAADSLAGLQDVPSDVKTVAYYCVDANSITSANVINRRTGQPESGLVRRVLDRAITQQASQSGNVQGLTQAAQVLAPEVRQVEFQYFDGTQWLTQWDSSQQQGLPVAVKISVYVQSQSPLDGTPAHRAAAASATPLSPEDVYSLVVHLPAAVPATSALSGTESSGSSNLDAVGL